MMPWNKLSVEDIENIEYWIDRHGSNDGEWSLDNRTASIEHLMRFWNQEKINLFNLFGEELILSKSVEINAPREELTEKMRDFINNNNFVAKYNDFIYNYRTSPAFEANRSYDDYDYNTPWRMGLLVEPYALTHNNYNYETFCLRDGKGKKIQIVEGCKAIKTLITLNKKFEFATKEEEEEFRIKHSQLTNTKTLKGTLHLSIHPLDYITMSDNTCNWTSCMAWGHNGDYRQGTIEMMNSPMVVVAYLDSDKPFYLDDDAKEKQWSNKKWRELFIINEDVLMGIKGYPYNNRELENFCLDWLLDLIAAKPECGFGPYGRSQQKIYNDCKNNWVSDETGEIKEVYVNIECNRMYNDIYDTHYGFINSNIQDTLSFNYSGYSLCLCCGQDMTWQWDEDLECSYLTCMECADLVYCYCCGCCHSRDSMIFHDGEYYCSYCYEDYVRVCPICGENHIKDEMYKVNLARLGKYTYNETFTNWEPICEKCFNKFEDEFMAHAAKFSTWYNEWVIDLECVPKTEENWYMLMKIFNVYESDLERWWQEIVNYVNMEDVKQEEMYLEGLKTLDKVVATFTDNPVYDYHSPFEPIKIATIDIDPYTNIMPPWKIDMKYNYITFDSEAMNEALITFKSSPLTLLS